jgi:hypothetical protein
LQIPRIKHAENAQLLCEIIAKFASNVVIIFRNTNQF